MSFSNFIKSGKFNDKFKRDFYLRIVAAAALLLLLQCGLRVWIPDSLLKENDCLSKSTLRFMSTIYTVAGKVCEMRFLHPISGNNLRVLHLQTFLFLAKQTDQSLLTPTCCCIHASQFVSYKTLKVWLAIRYPIFASAVLIWFIQTVP